MSNPRIGTFLIAWEKILTNGTVTGKQYGNSVYLTTYTNNATGEKFCFLSNSHNSQDAEVDLQQDGKYYVPAWSVSILQDCKKEVFNTAKVNTQTTVYVKKPATEGNPLKWVWTSDPMEDTLQGQGTFKASELLEQKGVTVDASDYLWYMTEVVINDTSSWQNATLHVTTTGHVLHAYVNGQYIGAQWGNWACKLWCFDLKDTGIVGGPVKLIGSDSNNVIDLTTSTWSYKVGLNGEAKRFYDPKFPNGVQWNTNSVPTGRPMTWYKTTFETPEGTDSLVLDLEGLGKGHAWVNGKSIGRYWPTMVADENGCSDTCDYRGNYGPERCVSDYGSTLEVNCQGGKTISEIQFASYGDPQGKCGSFQKGEWESRDSPTVVERACIGKGSCSIDVTSSTFGIRKGGTNGQLAVQLLCDGSNPEDGRVQRVRG
ncbi:Galactose-binding-like domain superfamily [Sesbania bispinosa]|nr:Galactose-binding-like domain superfamily [Sesbania bispinosa]